MEMWLMEQSIASKLTVNDLKDFTTNYKPNGAKWSVLLEILLLMIWKQLTKMQPPDGKVIV
jgi:hypothetical protein